MPRAFFHHTIHILHSIQQILLGVQSTLFHKFHEGLKCSFPASGERVQDESVWFRCPDFADAFVWGEAAEGLQSAGEVVGGLNVGAALIVAVVMEALDGRVLDYAVHSLDLAICPRMVQPGQPVLNPVGFADHVEAYRPGVDGVPIPRLFGKLDAIIGENSMDLIRRSLEHILKELTGRLPVCFVDELRHGKLAHAVDADKQIQLAFSGLKPAEMPRHFTVPVTLVNERSDPRA